jgi:hypothetical protein
MKNTTAILLGCIAIGLCVVIAGYRVADRIPGTLQGNFHGSLYGGGQTQRENTDYLNHWEAQTYLQIWDVTLHRLIQSGELDGTFVRFGDNYVFSRAKLSQWMDARIAEGAALPSGLEIDTDRVVISEWEVQMLALAALEGFGLGITEHRLHQITLLPFLRDIVWLPDDLRAQLENNLSIPGDNRPRPYTSAPQQIPPPAAYDGPVYQVSYTIARTVDRTSASTSVNLYISAETGEFLGGQ